jgi:hypothetical protein
MSRAYRIKVRESLKKVLRAHDHVSTQLEILEILPPEEMADLLRRELLGRGFEQQGNAMVRKQKGVTVKVEPETGTVTVEVETREELQTRRESEAWVGDIKTGKDALRKQLRSQLEAQAKEKEEKLQQEVTDRLEGQLTDLRQELDQAVNRVTAEALKRKAAQMGQIKAISEDPQSGSMTIVLEV